MASADRGRITTLLYVVYIALFLSLFAWSFLTFGLRLITVAFLVFVLLIILGIDFTSRIIYQG
jgi:tryptophan-rich sensory protein